eukprot:191337_1
MTQETSSKKYEQPKESSLNYFHYHSCLGFVSLVYLVTFIFVVISLPIIPVLVGAFLYKISIGTTILLLHCILLLSSIRYLNIIRFIITPLRPKIEYYCLTKYLISYKTEKWPGSYYKNITEKSKLKMLKTVPRKMKQLNVKINKTENITIKPEHISLLWKHVYHSHPNNILLALIIFFSELQPLMNFAPVLAIEFEVDNKMVAYGCINCSYHLFACHHDYTTCMVDFELYRQIYIEILNT